MCSGDVPLIVMRISDRYCNRRLMCPAQKRWIMKAPYTANSMHYKKMVNDPNEAMRHFSNVCVDMFGDHFTCYELPYLILQERVEDSSEAKLCFLNRNFSHFCTGSTAKTSIRHSLPGYTSQDLIEFGSEVLESLSGDNEFVLDGLLRVDIFKANDGRLVVNEIEGKT